LQGGAEDPAYTRIPDSTQLDLHSNNYTNDSTNELALFIKSPFYTVLLLIRCDNLISRKPEVRTLIEDAAWQAFI